MEVHIMTIKDRIDVAIRSADYDIDNIDKIISLAYYLGLEQGVRRVCTEHNSRAIAARQRAATSRYHLMAQAILGDLSATIYDSSYARDMTNTFADDYASSLF
jgi:hypothetical protein